MFLSDSHQPPMLEPVCYFSKEHHSREQSDLFLPAWNCVGSLAELPREGDFLTHTLLGRPLIVWKKQDEPHAFLNVCAHRFSKLTDKPCGRSDRLTCQYHGWQYDHHGKTQKIPDAQSFRPLTNQGLGLKKLNAIVLGQLIFTTFDDQAVTDSMSDMQKQVIGELVGENRRLVFRLQQIVEANWKVVIENAIESYHVGFVHQSSFATMPTAESCTHELGDDYSRFQTTFPSQAAAIVRIFERLIHGLLGMPYVERYQHFHFHPNLTIASSKMFSSVILVEPLSPTSSRLVLKLFGDPGERRNPAARLAFWFASRFAAREVSKVIQEDISVLPSIQAGLQSPDRPGRGFISIREERVFHFQKWVQSQLRR